MKDGAMDFSGGKKAEKEKEKKEEGKVKELAVKKELKSVEHPKKVSWSWSWSRSWSWSWSQSRAQNSAVEAAVADISRRR
jgi:hypothetical protein